MPDPPNRRFRTPLGPAGVPPSPERPGPPLQAPRKGEERRSRHREPAEPMRGPEPPKPQPPRAVDEPPTTGEPPGASID